MRVVAVLLGVLFLWACAVLTPTQQLSYQIERARDTGLINGSWADYLPPNVEYAIPPLIELANANGYEVQFVNIIELGYAGLTYFAPMHLIQVDPRLPPHLRVATLVHEVAHVFQPKDLPAGLPREVWAESVAMLACKQFGFDTTRESYSYLATVPVPMREAVLKHYGARIEATALSIGSHVKAAKGK